MDWAMRRKLLYASVTGLIILGVIIGSYFLFFYRAPTCTDGLLNQNEEGVDCGGVCAKLCQAPRVSAVWTRSVEISPGVFHAVAMVRNPETGAGTAELPYNFKLFDSKNILVAERSGIMRLDPGEIVPVLEANIVTGERTPVRTFIDFGQAVWGKADRGVSPVRVQNGLPDPDTLRLNATIENKTALPVPNIVLTALLYDTDGILITASQTEIATLAARGSEAVVFTWQEPFPRTVVRADVIARVK